MVHPVYNKFELSNCNVLSEMLLPNQSQSYIFHFKHVIYSMTCPCDEYDYVDSTSKTLAHAMACK